MKQGFTLIELLIVIVLLGLAIALVGPLTVQQVENARARNEQQSVLRWLSQQSFSAFAKQQQSEYLFDGKAIYLQAPQHSEPAMITSFNYLFFPPQQVFINQNGVVHPQMLQLNVNGRQQQIDLTGIFGDQHEG